MATSSISVYQQQAAKLLSRKSVVLGIPIAAGSIILFLQWRKRKSLKPKPKPGNKKQQEETQTTTVKLSSNGKATTPSTSNGTLVEESSETTPASAQNGSATTSVAAAPQPSGGSPSKLEEPTSPQISSTTPAASADSPASRTKHAQEDEGEEGAAGSGFAYAKRPRLGRGRSSEKFQSYEPLRRTSAEKREELEKQKIKEEDDRAAAAAVAAFSPVEPVPAAAAAAAVVQTESAPALAPKDEEVLPPPTEVTPEAIAAAIAAAVGGEVAPDEPVAPEFAVAPPTVSETTTVKVNGWHHDDEGNSIVEQPIRDSRRPSIIATTEISSTSEPAVPAGLSPHLQQDAFSRRPSVITTISAEPPIEEDDEDDQIEWAPESRRESATVETTIEIKPHNQTNGEREPPIFETTISGPISSSAAPAEEEDERELAPEEQQPIASPAPAALDAPPESSWLANRAVDAGVRDGEAGMRTDSPLSSKPVVVAAAAGVPAPQAAVVEGVAEVEEQETEVVERAPLAHLPGMGIPNSA